MPCLEILTAPCVLLQQKQQMALLYHLPLCWYLDCLFPNRKMRNRTEVGTCHIDGQEVVV